MAVLAGGLAEPAGVPFRRAVGVDSPLGAQVSRAPRFGNGREDQNREAWAGLTPKTDLPNRRNGASEPEGQLIPRRLGGSLARPMVLASEPNQIVLVGSWKNM